MSSTILKPIKAKVLRVVRLDTCGVPVTGASGSIITDGFISVQQSPQYEEGEEFVQRNAAGALCINEKDEDRLKRVDLTISLCAIDPAAIELMTGQSLITDGGDSIGVSFGEEPTAARWALELWNFPAGAECSAGETLYPSWIFPICRNGKLGDITHEYGTQAWEITASTVKAPTGYEDAFGLWTDLDGKHMAFKTTATEPPEPADGYQNLVLA